MSSRPILPARVRPAALALPAELRTLLRGAGQIVLQAHAGTGACVIAALVIADLALGCAALAGIAAANIAALLTGGGHPACLNDTDADDARRGLHGYSGALAALAPVALLADRSLAFGIALIAATVAGALYRPVARRLARVGGAAYSLPAALATWLWLPWCGSAPGLHPAAALVDARASAAGAAFASIAQAAFATGILPGLLMLAGIALASPRAAAFALGGALAASALLLVAGAPGSACAAGLLGYNGALAALALARLGPGVALPGALLAAVLQYGAARAGVPPLSVPFALAACAVAIVVRGRRGQASA